MVASGAEVKLPETTYIGLRVRSAEAGKLFEEEDAQDTVIKFQKATAPDEAWPDVVWDKKGVANGGLKYCSTQIGKIIDGDVKQSPTVLLKQLEKKALAKQLTEYLVQLAGGTEFLLYPPQVITDWLQSTYETMFKKIVDHVTVGNEVEQELKKSVGSFQMTSQILKKVYDAKKKDEVIPDADTDSDPDDLFKEGEGDEEK
jgi:hypothetical protein